MLDICKYQIGFEPVKSVTGLYLAHNGLNRVQKAFMAGDLATGEGTDGPIFLILTGGA